MRGVVFICLVICCLCVYWYDIIRDNETNKFLERQAAKVKKLFNELINKVRN